MSFVKAECRGAVSETGVCGRITPNLWSWGDPSTLADGQILDVMRSVNQRPAVPVGY